MVAIKSVDTGWSHDSIKVHVVYLNFTDITNVHTSYKRLFNSHEVSFKPNVINTMRFQKNLLKTMEASNGEAMTPSIGDRLFYLKGRTY